MFTIALIPASHTRKGSHPLSSNSNCVFPELPQLSTSEDCLQSELPPLPISMTGEASSESESPAVVAEQSYPEPEPATMLTMKCPLCPFGTFCQDKLQCSAFLTGFGEQIVQNTETSLGDWSGQKLFELLWSKS